jgi:hypothetical protein
MEWFRYYTRTLDCRKVQSLPDALFKVWSNLLCLSSVHGGSLPPLPEVAFRLRITEAEADRFTRELEAANLLDRNVSGSLSMHDWNEHQYVSDDVTKRVRKHRMKQAGNVSVTPSDTEQIQNRAEQTAEPPTAAELIQKLNERAKTAAPVGAPKENNRAAMEEALRLHEWTREVLMEFPGAASLSGAPDDAIIKRCLDLCESQPEVLSGALRRMHHAGKAPTKSWAWFPAVIPQYAGVL